jgi:uncharacterized protein YkwD
LAAAALAHSTDMACNDIVSHIGSDGSLWYNRVEAQGYANYNSSRENIYVGNPDFGGTADVAFNWWWNSQIHHDNILNPDVSQIGVAYVTAQTANMTATIRHLCNTLGFDELYTSTRDKIAGC